MGKSSLRISVLIFCICFALAAQNFNINFTGLLAIDEKADKNSNSFSYVFIGDSRHTRSDFEIDYAGNIGRMMMIRKLLDIHPEFIIHGGDFVNRGASKLEWIQCKKEWEPIIEAGIPIYPVIGNHEYKGGDIQAAMKNFTDMFGGEPTDSKWYTFEKGQILFIVLDSEAGIEPDSEQYLWLEKEMAEASKYTFIVPILHRPIFTGGRHNGEKEKRLQQILHPLFCKYEDKIPLVFASHNHSYERIEVDGINYVVSGGAGAPLYDVSSDTPGLVYCEKSFHYCILSVEKDSIQLKMYSINSDFEWNSVPRDEAIFSAKTEE